MSHTKKYGFLEGTLRNGDYIFGAITGINVNPLQLDGQWDSYLPIYEAQSTQSFDTMACVTFSALNCLETVYKRRYGCEKNWSDRYIAVLSETTPQGNYANKVWDTIRTYGLVDEQVVPFTGNTFNEYYKPISLAVQDKGFEFLETYSVQYDFVPIVNETNLVNALQYSPLQVSMCAYGITKDGIIQRTEGRINHMVTLYGYEYGQYWKIYDHYINSFKKLAWDYYFSSAFRSSLTRKSNMPKLSVPENCLLQLVEGLGGFGLYLNGKIYVDDTAKLLASFVIRNNGDLKGRAVPVTLDQWNSLPRFNLKNEKLYEPSN